MFDEMHEIASQLALKWARHGPDAPIMVTDDFTRLTLDTLALCTMGFRFNSYYHDELHPFISAIGRFLTESGSRSLRPSLAALFYRQANHPSNCRDLLSAMLDGVDPKTGQKLSDASIIDNLITFLIAGYETTVVGTGAIWPQHLKKLLYIEAILRETLRLCPTIPLIGKQAREDEIIGGQYSHLDPAVYGETAQAFVPERMLDENFERLTREYPDCWKPFGSGMRACIGRPFAWQEVIKQTLTIKPKDFYMWPMTMPIYAKPTSRQLSPAAAKSWAQVDAKPISIFYGSNMGTCESLAHRLAMDAALHGFAATVIEPLDIATEKLPTDRPVVVITAFYEGQPLDNAAAFCGWLQRCKADELHNVPFAVFGCGYHDWNQTFHRIPKLVDSTMEAWGGSRICEMRLTDVAEGDIFTDFEQWEDDVFWPAIEAKYGSALGAAVVYGEDPGDSSLEPSTTFSAGSPVSTGDGIADADVVVVVVVVLLTMVGPPAGHVTARSSRFSSSSPGSESSSPAPVHLSSP
ncbi:cytochrome P450 [Chaetomium strumarium]|uniref:Cytochrome P450 n=1 Tax=Chaetomium strumarium TaxID=1170767 RepID=A0AAJ0GPZ6_9PEZI|nr:cytochrome P450 [Chaetomium strumarium]